MSRRVAASRKPVWITLAIALVIHTGLVSVQAGHRIDTSFVRVWMLDSLAPIERVVDATWHGVTDVWQNYFALLGIRDQNERLKSQVNELRMQLEKQEEDVLEAQRLRALLAIRDSGIGKAVVARVIGSDPSRASETITIDKGVSHGLKPDTAVISPQGVVGRVIYSSNSFSIVQLILDSQSGVGVMQRVTRRQGIVKGTGGHDLELEYIDDDTDLKEGDAFITSGLDRIYPKGLPVGVISSIGPRKGLFKSIRVRPNADFGRLEEVLCIVEHPQNVDVFDPTQVPPSP